VGINRCDIHLQMVDNDDDDDDFDDGNDTNEEEQDYIVNVGDLDGPSSDGNDADVGSEDDGQPPGWAVLQSRLAEVRAQHRRHETDVGSPEFQIASITERINYLTSHLQIHPKDFSTRRGLVALVNKRRRLLNYLSRENETKYKDLISSLGIRHRAPGEVPSRAEQYSRFPVQKAIKKHLVKNKKK
jgi:small subunit ribosomal protein S15